MKRVLLSVLWVVRTILGIGLLVMAVIGAVLPVLQGWAFFLAAVAVLGPAHPITQWCWRWVKWFGEHFVELRIVKWARRQLNRIGLWMPREPHKGRPAA